MDENLVDAPWQGVMSGPTVLDDGVLWLENWLPYEFSLIANHVSAALARVYSERYNLSVTGWRVVAVLANHAPLSAKEVARLTVMNPVSITRAVTELMKLGMITRRVDGHDRRRVTIRLTQKGNTVYQEVVPTALAIEATLFEGMSAAEIHAIRSGIARLAHRASTLLTDRYQPAAPKPGKKTQRNPLADKSR